MRKSQMTLMSQMSLINTIMKALEKIRLRAGLSSDNLNYFLVKDPKFTRFYLLPKLKKRLHDVPGRPVISNCSFYTENIFIFGPPFATTCSKG